MNIDTPESRKRARALLLLGLDAIDAFDREQKWAESPGKYSQSVADRRRAEARVRGEELAGRFNALKREYEKPPFPVEVYVKYVEPDPCEVVGWFDGRR